MTLSDNLLRLLVDTFKYVYNGVMCELCVCMRASGGVNLNVCVDGFMLYAYMFTQSLMLHITVRR